MENNRDKVLKTLARKGAMSLLELMSVVDVPDSEIESIVKELQKDNLVKLSKNGTDEDAMDEIVTIREQGLRAVG